jgi:hypothetical protein
MLGIDGIAKEIVETLRPYVIGFAVGVLVVLLLL